jgi:N-acetyl-1-D-myo-inositol-2-amino-2-deoxy-alpha-D-glucopyranoside deacetylase
MGPILAIFAHPDDETFTTAGVLAAAVERGIPVTVVSATRGEEGESAMPGLDDPDRLGVVRERELRDAMRQIGVTDVRFLGYRDSGMEGSAAAEHPRAFVRIAPEAAAAKLVTLMRAIRPQTVITFAANGIYGHPDHLQAHRVALLAVSAAADSGQKGRAAAEPWRIGSLYFTTFPREEMLAIFDQPGSPLASLSPDARANLGTPRAEITYDIDISPWSNGKRAAIAAHRTQTAAGGPLSEFPRELTESQIRSEHFVRAPLPWSAIGDEPELDLIQLLARDHTAG